MKNWSDPERGKGIRASDQNENQFQRRWKRWKEGSGDTGGCREETEPWDRGQERRPWLHLRCSVRGQPNPRRVTEHQGKASLRKILLVVAGAQKDQLNNLIFENGDSV